MQARNLFLFALLLLLSSCKRETTIKPTISCAISNEFVSNANHPKAAKIQAIMDKYAAKGVPGMTVLIHDDNGFWIQSKGMADLENQIPMHPCHINKLGSVTKMMMGALTWQLVQEGKLDINAPISKYIPTVAEKVTNGKDITLAMLINHTSGIYDIARDLGYNLAVINNFTKSWTAAEILPFIANKTATNLPGAAVHYSNSNTMLESMIIEAATGRSHADLLRERILVPLGMTNTYYYNYSAPFPTDILAQGYLDFNNDGGTIQNISKLNPGSGNGYTGVYSTVTDLYKFMNALMVQKTLTTPANLDLILNSLRYDDKKTWQSSIGAIHREYIDALPDNVIAYGHAGGDIGYSANLSYFPQNHTIFAATYNYGTNLPSPLGDELNNLRKELIFVMSE